MGCGRKYESSSCHDGQGMVRSQRGCVCDVVKSILKIQNEAVRHDHDNCGTSCYLEPMGGLVSPGRQTADTRVFMLLDKHGKPLKALFMDKHGCFHTTIFFRVEEVFGCCATLRAIAPLKSDKEIADNLVDMNDNVKPSTIDKVCFFKKSDNCLTVDLNDFTAVQCLADVDLNIKKRK